MVGGTDTPRSPANRTPGTRLSENLLRACAIFGLAPEELAAAHTPPRFARALLGGLAGAERVLILGPSGAGKSTLLASLAAQHAAQGRRIVRPPELRRGVRVIDQMPGSAEQVLGILAAAGLSEAGLLARTPAELSEGQRQRLRLARAMAMVERMRSRTAVLVIDELGSSLDRVTALGVCASLSRWARRGRVRLVAATNREELSGALSPQVCAWVDLRGGVRLERCVGTREPRA